MSTTTVNEFSNWINSSIIVNSSTTFINNTSSDSDEEEFHEFTRAVSNSVFFTFSFIFLIGLIGNLLVVTGECIFICDNLKIPLIHSLKYLIQVVIANPLMRSTTNILILNLAVSDLLFVIFCKLSSFFIVVSEKRDSKNKINVSSRVGVPFTATDYVLTYWPFGDIMCSFVSIKYLDCRKFSLSHVL
jgi:allatostatin A receptor